MGEGATPPPHAPVPEPDRRDEAEPDGSAMTEAVKADLAQGDTERNSLIDMAADHLAQVFIKLRYPLPYRSVRYSQGYVIEISAREYRKQDTRPVDEDERIAD
jgi:hypothetical protein